MTSLLIKDIRLAGSRDDSLYSIFIKDDRTALVEINVGTVEENSAIDGKGTTVFPGFIDVHNHGAVGVDVNTADVDGLVEVSRFLARNGVTAWMPTLVPDSDENYVRAIAAIDELIEIQQAEEDAPKRDLKDGELKRGHKTGARAVGVHYEGVFANEKMCGALRPQYFKSGRQVAVNGWQLPRLKKGVHMTTLAPEVEGGIEIIKKLKEAGWVVAIGHTKADPRTLNAAYNAGAGHLTHFFNAMSGIHHRELGVAGWAMSRRDVTFDIIADGIHVAPEMLEFSCRAKGVERVSLISDSVAPTGLGDGEFELWEERVTVNGGRTRNDRGSIAGSVITMLDAVRRMRSLGFSDADVEKMASLNPARLLGIEKEHGSVEIGKRADLVGLNSSGEVELVLIGGVPVELG